MVTGAGIEPATLALKVRCSTTELPGLGGRRRNAQCKMLNAENFQRGHYAFGIVHFRCHCTVNGTDASVVSQVMTIDPPGPASLFLIAKVNCSTGVSSGRFSNVIRPRSALEL